MLQQHPSISVVIPLYNKKEHIVRCVESVLSQTVKPDEIIIVDDGSTDGGGTAILEKYKSSIVYIQQANGGVSKARNRAIESAQGSYIAFLDADDCWEPHFLEEIRSMITEFPEAKVLATNYQKVIGEEEYIDPCIRMAKRPAVRSLMKDYFEISAKGDLPFTMSCLCIQKDEFANIGLFPEGEPMGEDQEVFAKAAINSKIAYSTRVCSFYHVDAENRACLANVPVEECPFSQRLKLRAMELAKGSALQEAILNYTASHLLHIASLNIRSGNLKAARKILHDDRCRRNIKRYIWWNFRYLMARFAF